MKPSYILSASREVYGRESGGYRHIDTEKSLWLLPQSKYAHKLQNSHEISVNENISEPMWKKKSKHLITSGNRGQCGCLIYRQQNKEVPYLPDLTRVKVK